MHLFHLFSFSKKVIFSGVLHCENILHFSFFVSFSSDSSVHASDALCKRGTGGPCMLK